MKRSLEKITSSLLFFNAVLYLFIFALQAPMTALIGLKKQQQVGASLSLSLLARRKPSCRLERKVLSPFTARGRRSSRSHGRLFHARSK